MSNKEYLQKIGDFVNGTIQTLVLNNTIYNGIQKKTITKNFLNIVTSAGMYEVDYLVYHNYAPWELFWFIGVPKVYFEEPQVTTKINWIPVDE